MPLHGARPESVAAAVTVHAPLPLPGVLAAIADVAGEDAALAIAQARGGTQIYLPPAPGADHWLSQLVGHDAALAIGRKFADGHAGVRVDLPLGPTGHVYEQMMLKRAEMDAMIASGRSERDIALATGYTIRTVRRRIAKIGRPVDDRQLPLF
ncbi:hypothetical protein KRZ98_06320 [Sphingobium sp. AS12]|uniref:hypothetical protein n=1 Tax=Sphingobium sp. AS12 TaxID=2849495 RepID=UPI001C312FC8|nr:hypothetical protein [Sphingobium sp. AS12]MBV2147905.1 hypothetical protein [Sphingobium sp. AS12]